MKQVARKLARKIRDERFGAKEPLSLSNDSSKQMSPTKKI